MEGVQKILTEYFDIYDKMPAEKARQALFSAYDEEVRAPPACSSSNCIL